MNNVEERVQKILDLWNEDQAPTGAKLDDPFQDHGIDSLAEIEFMLMVEEEFGVNVHDETARAWESPADAVQWLQTID